VDHAHDSICLHKVAKRFRTSARGELTCVLGPSGCGKTTLLRLIAGLDHPTEGEVLLDGRPVTRPSADAALLTQEGDLLPWRRVVPNVALGLEIRGIDRRNRHARAMEALRCVGLGSDVAWSYPHELSGGMRRRVAMARALCAQPRTLLMDEPFSNLDEPTRYRLQAELMSVWHADRQTGLFVTHDVEEAVYLADQIVLMTFGRVVGALRVDVPRPRDRLADDFVRTLVHIRRLMAEHEAARRQ